MKFLRLKIAWKVSPRNYLVPMEVYMGVFSQTILSFKNFEFSQTRFSQSIPEALDTFLALIQNFPMKSKDFHNFLFEADFSKNRLSKKIDMLKLVFLYFCYGHKHYRPPQYRFILYHTFTYFNALILVDHAITNMNLLFTKNMVQKNKNSF